MSTRRLFQSTPSGGKATGLEQDGGIEPPVSIHAFRGEGDASGSGSTFSYPCFNPRLPGGRRLALPSDPRGSGRVSIHAFRGEGDVAHCYASVGGCNVSIHAFRGEGDARSASTRANSAAFQSTPSGGKATAAALWLIDEFNVSIHAFRGEGDRNI